MNEIWKEKWIAALRSGEYHQARERLRTDSAMCCLGVACDISGIGGWTFIPTVQAWSYTPDGSQYGDVNALPIEVMEAFGLDSKNPNLPFLPKDVDSYYKAWSLAEANDSGFTFDQIADLIDYFL